jgi:hypothetical protein
METNKLQDEEKPTYILSYSRWVRLGRFALIVVLIVAALVRWGMAWVHFVRPAVVNAGGAGEPARVVLRQFLDILAFQPLRPLIAAHLGLVLTAVALAFVYTFLPDLSLTDEGLAMRTLMGWRAIPWTMVKVVRIASFDNSKRRLVLVQGRWSRWALWPRVVSACLGAGSMPGIFFTSALRDFKPLMRRLYQEVTQANPEALFDDNFFSLPARVIVEPTSTLADLTEQAREEGWPLDISAQAIGAVAVGLVVVQLLMLLLLGGGWWKPLILIALVAAEWGIGAFYLFALAEFFPAHIEFREGALLYPLAQVPRALLSLPMAMFVVAGLSFLAAMIGFIGVLWAVTLTALLVQQMYRLESVLPAMIGAAIQALFQFLLLAIIFSL